MTRQEAIEHWKFVVHSVFKAENKLKTELKKIVDSDIPQDKKAEKYLEMIAEEILKSTSDEELKKL